MRNRQFCTVFETVSPFLWNYISLFTSFNKIYATNYSYVYFFLNSYFFIFFYLHPNRTWYFVTKILFLIFSHDHWTQNRKSVADETWNPGAWGPFFPPHIYSLCKFSLTVFISFFLNPPQLLNPRGRSNTSHSNFFLDDSVQGGKVQWG